MQGDIKVWKDRKIEGVRSLGLKAENEQDAELLRMLADVMFAGRLRGELRSWLENKLAEVTGTIIDP